MLGVTISLAFLIDLYGTDDYDGWVGFVVRLDAVAVFLRTKRVCEAALLIFPFHLLRVLGG